jgi:ATP-dependent Clp protease ATP-binding subunit ClpC
VGYEDAGQLTEAIRRRPYSIVVFDEIEKAHPEAFNMLLQIMEEGHLSDARGRMVDFRNAIIIMTSNIGADTIKRSTQLGFNVPRDEEIADNEAYDDMRKKLMEQLRRAFRPEFLNRVDATIVFRSLNKAEIAEIVDLLLNDVRERLAEHGVRIEMTQAAVEYLAEEGFDPEYGARPLRRVIQNQIEDALSDNILMGRFETGTTILVDYVDDELVFNEKTEEMELPAPMSQS